MKLLNPLEAGCDEEGLKELFLGDPLGNILLPKWENEIINKLGEDKVTQILINKLGKEKLLSLVDKLSKEDE